MSCLSLDIQHLQAQQVANHRGQLQLHDTLQGFSQHLGSQAPETFPWPSPDDFRSAIAWLGDSLVYPEEATVPDIPAAQPNILVAHSKSGESESGSDRSSSGVQSEDEDMAQLADDVV